MDIIESLTLPAVRDLCWVMASPSLITASDAVSDDDCLSIAGDGSDWLRQQDKQPASLQRWIDRHRSARLGYYFEQLVAYWLCQRIAPGRVKSHVRVFRDKRVLGEYDFLFRRLGAENIEHWETAVKFYLRYRDVEGKFHWLGPNTNDTLDKKLSRLINHQLKLSDFPEARPVLRDAARELSQYDGFPDIESKAFVKGYLFYPSTEDWRQPASLHPAAAPGHLRGWWTRMNELFIPGGEPGVRYRLLPRLCWLAPRSESADQDGTLLLDNARFHEVIENHFERAYRPILAAVLAQDSDGYWRERSRGFVVSSGWPNTPESSAG